MTPRATAIVEHVLRDGVRCLICPTSEVHMLITDREAGEDTIRPFRDRGIDLRLA